MSSCFLRYIAIFNNILQYSTLSILLMVSNSCKDIKQVSVANCNNNSLVVLALGKVSGGSQNFFR